MIRRNRSVKVSGPVRYSKHLLIAGMLFSVTSAAFGWGGPSHSMLAGNIFNDPTITGFATEFNIDVNSVTSWTSEPPSDWHHPGWAMVKARGYLGTYNGKDWTTLSETTRLRYLTHILMDAGVPVSHSPANQVYVSTFNEGVLEAQASTWSDSPNISGTSFNGTVATINNTFESQCVSNASAFKNTRNWLGLHSVDDNRHHGWIGQTLALKMSRAVLSDYFLAKRDTIAEAGSGYGATPGSSVTLSAAGSQDPDSITWNSNATYYNNGGGIVSYEWDLDNDGQYDDATGISPNVSHAYLANTQGYNEWGRPISVRVTDNEGKSATDTSSVRIFSNPVVHASATYQTLKRNQTLYLHGWGSDADGGYMTSFAWDIDGDGQYDDSTINSPAISYDTLVNLGLTPGNSYTVSLIGTDNDGAYAGQDTDSFTLIMDTSYNIASQATVTVDSVNNDDYIHYDPGNIVDGELTGNLYDGSYWASNSSPDNHWIKLEWDEQVSFDQVHLYSNGYNPNNSDASNIRDFLIQIWDDSTSSWLTVDTIDDNTLDVYSFISGTTLSTDALRILITDACLSDNFARVLEVEVGYYGSQQIPEPATLVTLVLGGVLGLRIRKK